MRESKFRAWHKSAGMCEVISLALSSHLCTELRDMNGVSFSVESRYEFVLMQSTGLLDRDGREIFEGDILTSDATGKMPGLVRWHEGAFVLDFRNAVIANVRLSTAHTVLILGNTYENPELLQYNPIQNSLKLDPIF